MASKIITKSIVSALIVVALVSPPAFAQDYDAIKRQQQQRAEVQRQQKEAERVAAEKADRAQETAEGMQALAALKSMGSTRMRNTYPGLADSFDAIARSSWRKCGDELHVYSPGDLLLMNPRTISPNDAMLEVKISKITAISEDRVRIVQSAPFPYFSISEEYNSINNKNEAINAKINSIKYPVEEALFALMMSYNGSSLYNPTSGYQREAGVADEGREQTLAIKEHRWRISGLLPGYGSPPVFNLRIDPIASSSSKNSEWKVLEHLQYADHRYKEYSPEWLGYRQIKIASFTFIRYSDGSFEPTGRKFLSSSDFKLNVKNIENFPLTSISCNANIESIPEKLPLIKQKIERFKELYERIPPTFEKGSVRISPCPQGLRGDCPELWDPFRREIRRLLKDGGLKAEYSCNNQGYCGSRVIFTVKGEVRSKKLLNCVASGDLSLGLARKICKSFETGRFDKDGIPGRQYTFTKALILEP